MKPVFISCISILYHFVSIASTYTYTDSLADQLNRAIKDAQVYDNKKLKDINTLKGLLGKSVRNEQRARFQYNIYLKLYEEYKYYNYDSALAYAGKLQEFAKDDTHASLLVDAKLKVAFIMLSGGMFKETFDSLNAVHVKGAADSIKAEYYLLMGLSFFNLADFNNDNLNTPGYNKKALSYLDSALSFYKLNSFEHLYYSSLKFLKKGYQDSALSNLHQLDGSGALSLHQTALVTSTIGGILTHQGDQDQAAPYLTKASIADIKSSTKETLALLLLAGIVYRKGEIEDAVRYIEKANADAKFYNARLRKVQVGSILPLIEGEMVYTIKAQKNKLEYSLILLVILVLLLTGFAVIIRKQVKKLKKTRANLFEANLRQQQINQELSDANDLKESYNKQLTEINHQLLEANKIKEEYIGYYFKVDAGFLAVIEKLITSIDKKLTERKWEDIKGILKSVDPKREKEELIKSFDKVFLRLFPNFVTEFNSMFQEEDKIILKEGQLLNTELRIFALIRLGITDNDKIAEILDYSINTIYSKKTKIRSKTIVSKDEFERKIVEITTLRL